jgi:hypothetical protein
MHLRVVCISKFSSLCELVFPTIQNLLLTFCSIAASDVAFCYHFTYFVELLQVC